MPEMILSDGPSPTGVPTSSGAPSHATPLLRQAEALARGETTSERLIGEALDRAENPSGEGARVFTRLYRESAPLLARAADIARRNQNQPFLISEILHVLDDYEAVLRGLSNSQDAELLHGEVQRIRAASALIVRVRSK